mgnify:FL=1
MLMIAGLILAIPLRNLWQLELGYKVFYLVLLLYWVRILVFEGVRWWMNRKY